MATADAMARVSQNASAHTRRTRRHPRLTQFDYLHLRRLLDALVDQLGDELAAPDVLDIFCGTRPYDDLLPPSARVVGLDVTDAYGVADVVSQRFLPFPDRSFDLALCVEAFHLVVNPEAGVAEIRRILRPGGRVIMSVPLVWQYDRSDFEHRYTDSSLANLFTDWTDVSVDEIDRWAVTWTSVTTTVCRGIEERIVRRLGSLGSTVRAAFSFAYVVLNTVGLVLDAVERRLPPASASLSTGLIISARRPQHD